MLDLAVAILDVDPSQLLSELLFEEVPYVFAGSWDACRAWKGVLAQGIEVDPSELVIVGSAAAGRSLSPYKNLKPFDEGSDVDVAVVSEHFFSVAWHHLRRVDLALDPLTPAQKAAVVAHRTKFIYWGCIATDKLLPILPFASTWMSVRSQLAQLEPTVGRDINFRVYKDFAALRGYQLDGLKQLRLKQVETEGEANAGLPEYDHA